MAEKSVLHLARERKRLKQDDIAALMQVTQATVSNWETGAAAPHPALWKKITKVYDVSLRALVEHFSKVGAP